MFLSLHNMKKKTPNYFCWNKWWCSICSHVLMAVTRKCFSRGAIICNSVSVSSGSELLYNLTADVDKRQKSQPSRVYFTQSGSQISQLSQQLNLDINKEQCQRFTAFVKVSSDCLVFLLVVRVGVSLVLLVSWADLSVAFPWPGNSHPAMLMFDMNYLLMWSVFPLYLLMCILVGTSKYILSS